MNSTISNCSLNSRVYTPGYLFSKLINATYLRVLVGPGILLNILCLIVLSRPKLSNKSTTIIFLRFLAVFDILAVIMKYLRAEMNYQSTEKGRQVILLVPAVCKTIYVSMSASISIAMWIIVLMSFEKAVAVSFPLKSSIWITHRRAVYICCITIITLLLANLSFIKLSGIHYSRHRRKYCGFNEQTFIVDLLTASILPIGLITITNIVIAVVLHRVSRTPLDWRTSDDHGKQDFEPNLIHARLSAPSCLSRPSASSSVTATDIALAAKRRTSTQVTRMLLAVTLSLIICNIPNTIFFVVVKIYDTRGILFGRLCEDVSDRDIALYKIGFYSSIIQDILSDLPHIFNFFLYCLAGQKFRSIFINKLYDLLRDLHLMKNKQGRFKNGTYPSHSEVLPDKSLNPYHERMSTSIPLVKQKETTEVLFNNKTTKTILARQKHSSLDKTDYNTRKNGKFFRSYTTIQ